MACEFVWQAGGQLFDPLTMLNKFLIYLSNGTSFKPFEYKRALLSGML
jgi:hypothetical protein